MSNGEPGSFVGIVYYPLFIILTNFNFLKSAWSLDLGRLLLGFGVGLASYVVTNAVSSDHIAL